MLKLMFELRINFSSVFTSRKIVFQIMLRTFIAAITNVNLFVLEISNKRNFRQFRKRKIQETIKRRRMEIVIFNVSDPPFPCFSF